MRLFKTMFLSVLLAYLSIGCASCQEKAIGVHAGTSTTDVTGCLNLFGFGLGPNSGSRPIEGNQVFGLSYAGMIGRDYSVLRWGVDLQQRQVRFEGRSGFYAIFADQASYNYRYLGIRPFLGFKGRSLIAPFMYFGASLAYLVHAKERAPVFDQNSGELLFTTNSTLLSDLNRVNVIPTLNMGLALQKIPLISPYIQFGAAYGLVNMWEPNRFIPCALSFWAVDVQLGVDFKLR